MVFYACTQDDDVLTLSSIIVSVDFTLSLRYPTLTSTSNRVGVVYFLTRKDQYLHFQMQTIHVNIKSMLCDTF